MEIERYCQLDKHTVELYLKNSDRCPYCGSPDLEGEGVDVGGGTATQEVTCGECRASWTDKYQLVGLTVHFQGTGGE